MNYLFSYSDGLIEAASLTVGDDHEDIVTWIDYYADAVQRRLPSGVYYDRRDDSVRLYDTDEKVTDRHGHLLDDFELDITEDSLEAIMRAAERETDDWWNDDEE